MSTALVKLAEETPHSVPIRIRRPGDYYCRYGRTPPGYIVDRMLREFKVEANVVNPRLPIVKPSVSRLRAKVGLYDSPVVEVNTATWYWKLNHWSQVPVMNLLTR